jgi:hypothetical protein
MKTLTGLFQSFDRQQASREIEDELRLHLDLLTDEICRRDLPRVEARTRAEAQFGNFEQIRDQCVKISTRNNPLTRALKSVLILVFLIGILVKVLSTEYHVTRTGVMLMTLGLLGRLFLYVRGLTPSTFLSRSEISSPLMLIDKSQTSIAAYDRKKRTPVERVIFDK